MTELTTSIDESPVLETSLEMPYTLTMGRAASVFLAELGRRRLTGSRCAHCDRLVVPAQDFCSRCGTEQDAFVTVAPVGTVTAVTRSDNDSLALIRIDGADSDLLHRIESDRAISIGDRVVAEWAENPGGTMLDLRAFVLLREEPPTAAATPVSEEAQADLAGEVAYALSLPYRHSYGPNYGRLFDELGAQGSILGAKCSRCHNVLVPPRAYCDVCYVKTEQFVHVADTGRLQAFSVIHMEFVGQTRTPPYVYAEVVLDGSATRLIHTVAGIDPLQATDLLSIGMPVRAVWRPADQRTGTLNDIEHFEPIFDGHDA